MKKDNVISLEKPAENRDSLTETLQAGAKELLTKAVQAEMHEYLSLYQDVIDGQGRQCVVRNGYLPRIDSLKITLLRGSLTHLKSHHFW